MASISGAQVDALDQIFQGLRSKSHDVRLQSAIDLQRYVRTPLDQRPRFRTNYAQVSDSVHDASSDASVKLWEETINRRLFDLVHSQSNSEKLGGILAIGECSADYSYCLYQLA